jgi:Flp pilus assembly protein CpaB
MSSQAPRGRPSAGSGRSGGGRALMLFGVLLAILSGVLVIFIVSQATSGAGQTVPLVVVTQNIPTNTLMSPATIKSDFGIENYPANLVPSGAFVYTNQDALNVHLANLVNLYPLVPGDILLSSDSRFVSATANGHSITNINPQLLTPGMVLYAFNYAYPSNSASSFINPGDVVDILAMECNAPYATSSGQCVDATTLPQIVVYSVYSSSVVLLVNEKQAKELSLLAQSGTVTLVLRNPKDKTQDTSGALTPEEVAKAFGYP